MIPGLPWRRRIVDKLTARVVGFGGAVIIGAITLIFFYLLWVAAPIFRPAAISELDGLRLPARNILAAGSNDSVESLYAIDADGTICFVDPETSALRRSERLTQYPLAAVRLVFPSNDIYALVGEDGSTTFVRVRFRRRFDGDVGYLEDRVDRLFGGEPLPLGAMLAEQTSTAAGAPSRRLFHGSAPQPAPSASSLSCEGCPPRAPRLKAPARPRASTMDQTPAAAGAPSRRLFHGSAPQPAPSASSVPAPRVDHGSNARGRWRSLQALVPWKCPTAGAFGFVRGPAPRVDHGSNARGRWRSLQALVPWK